MEDILEKLNEALSLDLRVTVDGKELKGCCPGLEARRTLKPAEPGTPFNDVLEHAR